ncbi:MAG: HDIG domain-containing protein [Anaerolineae bacterium]|nr:HDIG domain-containing protein [Anaerolineae bacterium]
MTFYPILKTTTARLQRIVMVGLAVIYLILGTIVLAYDAIFPSDNTYQLHAGDIASDDIFAPEDRTYESAVLTDQARQVVRSNARPVYDRIANVSRDQVETARNIVEYISLTRNDQYATREQKLSDLQAIEVLKVLDIAFWQTILDTNFNDWQAIEGETIAALERTMRRDISPELLTEERQAVPSRVDASLPESQQNVVVAIVRELVVPNSQLNGAETLAAQETAATLVEPLFRTFREGQILISKGQQVTEVDVEALRQYGLLQRQESRWTLILGGFLMLVVVSGILLVYLNRFYPNVSHSPAMLGLIATLFLEFLMIARLFHPSGINELFPAAALALLLTTLAGPHLALIVIMGLALLVGTMIDSSMGFVGLIGASGAAGILGLRHIERLNAYFVAGAIVGLINVGLLVAFQLVFEENTQVVDLGWVILLGMGNGIFVAMLAFAHLYVITNVLNLPTSLKLDELNRSNQPLLQRLLREAPGTYQHSLQVGNLAEVATERIGGNAALVRVAAMYHDIGKMLNPHFYVENQAEGFNPHDVLDDPIQSARLIIGHVVEGERMARRYRLPPRIRDFIREHHGTTRVIYFYHKALEQVGGDESKVSVEDFTYPGPRPQSKETAILMLADGTESAARAIKPHNESEVAEVVSMIFERALQEEQLDDCNLTLKELKIIQQSFIETLQGVYHPRIAYPTPQKKRATLAVPAYVAPRPELTEPTPVKPVTTIESKAEPPPEITPKSPKATTGEYRNISVGTYGAIVSEATDPRKPRRRDTAERQKTTSTPIVKPEESKPENDLPDGL